MADSDQILQLGIEEARNGNREAARNLFELLTRQEPNNTQAWLWLAGVADGPDQRREALQQVIALEPSNEMARKGLQAMGVAVPEAVEPTIMPSTPSEAFEPEPTRAPEPVRERSADEAFADELDLAFDDTYASVPRAEAAPRSADQDAATVSGAADGRGSRSEERPTVRRSRISVRPRADEIDDRDEDDEDAPRSGPPLVLWVFAGVAALLIVGWLISQLLGLGTPTTIPLATSTTVAEATKAPDAAGEPTAAPAGEATPVPAGEPTPAPAAAPTAVPQPVTPPEQANPAPVPVGTTLQANGWSYSYPNANYAVVLGKTAGGQTAQGSFVHVLAWVANTTGSDQVMPADFFVLKDAQGRVYTASAKLSSALVQRGVNADIGLEDAVPANGVTTSVYLVFDVQPGATDLTLFARGNPAQGFRLGVTVP